MTGDPMRVIVAGCIVTGDPMGAVRAGGRDAGAKARGDEQREDAQFDGFCVWRIHDF